MNHNAIENYIPKHVKEMLAQLNDLEATSEAALCGGALRDLYLGGEVSDWDIFCTVRSGDLETISKIFYIVSSLGFTISHSHGNGYAEGSDGFIADFRLGDINFILYGATSYCTIDKLVLDFDLNINAWVYYPYDPVDRVVNLTDWDKTKPVKVLNQSKDVRMGARLPRFKAKYPNLLWGDL